MKSNNMKIMKTYFLILLLILFINNSSISQTTFEYKEYVVIQNKVEFNFQITPPIQQFIRCYQGRSRKSMEASLANSGRFYEMATRIFREEGLPEQLVWISHISNEWGNNPKLGLWFFNDDVAKKYGLEKTELLNERLSFEQSTRAIARHLKHLSEKYDKNWKLVIASYYSGEQAVDDAIKKSQSKDFQDIYKYLHRDERNFVPKVLATIAIANKPEKYGFGKVEKKQRVKYDRVRIPASTDLRILASVTQIDFEDIEKINPELLTDTTPPVPYVVRFPLGTAELIVGYFRLRQ
ncbi:MAG: transglycosylase SLT domain-containing protein [Acidobacteriota bacterium]|jgi:membrane-bound lytic murein transglycosylase D|nr:transglycosylase SLT domain-containing protein [Acidobacteriota bacterium]